MSYFLDNIIYKRATDSPDIVESAAAVVSPTILDSGKLFVLSGFAGVNAAEFVLPDIGVLPGCSFRFIYTGDSLNTGILSVANAGQRFAFFDISLNDGGLAQTKNTLPTFFTYNITYLGVVGGFGLWVGNIILN